MKLDVKLFGVIPLSVETEIRYVPFIEKRLFADGAEGEVIGRAHWTYVEILESEKDNKGLLAHELEHCRQGWILPFLHKALRGVSLRYREYAEASAYAKQLMAYGRDDQYYTERLDAYAYLLANAYGLAITIEKAKQRILEECD